MELVAAATYAPGPSAAGDARRLIREALEPWDAPGGTDLLADAELLTSELVTNAIVHAGTEVQVSCRAGRCEVEVSVLDREPGRTVPASPDHPAGAHQSTGRGLLLSAALSSSWGITYAPAAKTVWFRLTLPGAPSDPAARSAAAADQGPARFRNGDELKTLPLGRARPEEEDRVRYGQISFLAEASHLLAGTLDQQQAIALAAQLVVPRLADWCAVLLTDDHGEARAAHVWHADEARNDALSCLLGLVRPPVAPGNALPWSLSLPPGQALPPGVAELAADPAWCFPLLVRGHSLGILIIGRPGRGASGGRAVELAEDLASRMALALDNARLYEQQRQASHALQRSLLPARLPEIDGLGVAAGYLAAGEGDEVGGDFYDVFQVGPDRWRFALGDVCGKGLEAAAVTGLTRHALRILAREGHDIPAVVARLNSLLLDDSSAVVPFVTLIHGELVLAPGRAAVSLVCAGHPPPLLLRADGATQVAAGAQPLLGVMDDAKFRSDTCQLDPGDVLLCVTDGVTERRSGNRLLGDDNGLQQRLSDCSGLSAGAVAARIQREASAFGSGALCDDLALIVFRCQDNDRSPEE